jgi:Zn-dependent M16 (insulinase) family peptidase
MMETGAGEYDSVGLSRKIGTHTGGVGVTLLSTAVHPSGCDESISTNGELMQTKLVIQGKATSEKINELLSIFKLVLTDANLDSPKKLLEVLKESKARLESRIQGAGHSIVNTRMKARYRVGAFIDEITEGLTYLDTLRSLIKQAEEDWPSLLARLEKIRNTLLDPSICRSGMVLDITGDKQVLEAIQPEVEHFLGDLPGESTGEQLPDPYTQTHSWVKDAKEAMETMAPVVDEGFIVPTQVSYVGKSGFLYDEGEHIPGSSAVVARFLRTGYLWDYVRVIGGAYGGFCTFSPFSGFITFLSYRDPNLVRAVTLYGLT